MAGGPEEKDRALFDLSERNIQKSGLTKNEMEAQAEARKALYHKGVDPASVERICNKYAYEPLESLIKLRTTMIPLFKKVRVKNAEGLMESIDEQVKDSFGNLVYVPLCGPDKAIAIDMEVCKYKHSQKKSVDMKVGGPTGITVILSDVPPAIVEVEVPENPAPEKPALPAGKGDDDVSR